MPARVIELAFYVLAINTEPVEKLHCVLNALWHV